MAAVLNMKTRILILLLCFSFSTWSENLVDNKNNNNESESFQLDFNTTTLAQWPDVLSSYHGKILVLDMWATWCISCLERFPHMVEMADQYKKYGVVFISLLLEDPEEPEAIAKAQRFLIKHKANFKHYFMNDNLMKSFDQLDLLGIPAVFIYDQSGKQTHKLTGDNPNKQFTEQDIYDAINGLIVDQYKAAGLIH